MILRIEDKLGIQFPDFRILHGISQSDDFVVCVKKKCLMFRFGREQGGAAEKSCGVYCHWMMKVIVFHESFNLFPFFGIHYHKEVDINIGRGFETVNHLFPVLEFHPAVGASGGIDICDDLEIGGIEIVIHGDITYLKSKFTGNYDFLAGSFGNNVPLLLV